MTKQLTYLQNPLHQLHSLPKSEVHRYINIFPQLGFSDRLMPSYLMNILSKLLNYVSACLVIAYYNKKLTSSLQATASIAVLR
jgi:hypothetical protein